MAQLGIAPRAESIVIPADTARLIERGCSTCGVESLPSNLYHFGDTRTCPTCMATVHERQQAERPGRHREQTTHQPAHGLVVVDIERGNAGRVIAMRRRRERRG